MEKHEENSVLLLLFVGGNVKTVGDIVLKYLLCVRMYSSSSKLITFSGRTFFDSFPQTCLQKNTGSL